ncbi:MAG: hypothetical protein EGR43_09775 [Prevotella sp.]|nr:hypothetical protein [Prevotella sp.]
MVPGILRGAVESSLRRQRHRVRICEDQDQLLVIYHRAEMTMYKKRGKERKDKEFPKNCVKESDKKQSFKSFLYFCRLSKVCM